MCVVFQFLPTWEKPQEDLQFLYETYPQTALKQALKKKKGIHSKESITDPGLDLTHLGTVSKKKRQKVFSAQNVGRKNLFIDMKYIYIYVCMYVCMYRHTQIIS